MDISYEKIKIGQDEQGIYFEINFTPNKMDKIYADEFFEEFIEQGKEVNLKITPYVKERARPEGFYDRLDPAERERIKKVLDLRPVYPEIRPDLNSYLYLRNQLDAHPPKLKFTATTILEHQEWMKSIIKTLKNVTRYELGSVPLQVEEGPETEFEDLILKKIYLTTAPDLKVPGILARPKHMDRPKPGIVCVHGHNKGKINSIGMEPSSSNSYYGIELAKRGYVTLSLDQWGWGERQGRYKHTAENAEAMYSLSALLLGKTAIGIRCWDVSRAIDYLQTLDYVAPKFAIIGQSGGGTTSAFSSIMDDRITAAVVSGYFCTWTYSILSLHHCACNFVPGIMQYMDFPDMMAARAPKPLFVVAGERDGIFPIEGVTDAYEKVKAAYFLYNATDKLGIDIIPETGHVFRGDYAYPWLDKMLLE
jgi:dienelactone hydrolase